MMELHDEEEKSNKENVEKKQQSEKKKKRFNPFHRTPEEVKDEKERRKQKRARIIVRNISYKASEETLKKHFEQFGEVKELNLLKRPDGKLVGCAFVQFESVNQAAKAILKGNNKEYLGRPIFIDWALGKDEYVKKTTSQKKELKQENDTIKEQEIKTDENENLDEFKKPEAENSDSDCSEVSDDDDAFSKSDGNIENDDGLSSENEHGYNSDENDVKLKIKKENLVKDGKKSKISNDVKEGCTIFIKNIPFDATDNDLRKVCSKYGPIYYAIINTDPISGHSKGTAFVKFKSKESADLCLKAGEEFNLYDTLLEPFPALSREEVREQTDKSKQRESSDSRNLYLAKEGLIMTGSKAAEGVSSSDMAKRHELERIKTQILKNLNR